MDNHKPLKRYLQGPRSKWLKCIQINELTENLWQILVDKGRLVKQDDFITRQKFEAKDQAMEILKTGPQVIKRKR